MDRKKRFLFSCFFIAVFIFSQVSYGTVLFEDNFDSHTDWSPTQLVGSNVSCWGNCSTDPTGYDGYFIQMTSFTSAGHNTMTIDSTNHRGASGKGLTYWSESCSPCAGGGSGWGSDGLLNINLSPGYTDLYTRFFIKFQPGWQWSTSQSPMQKFIHISHYKGGDPFKYFTGGNHQPIAVADLAKYNYGASDISFLSAYRYEIQYYPDTPINYHPRNTTTYFGNGNYGGTGKDFGDSGMIGDGNWHSWEFHVKANSAVGIADGKFEAWLDGVLIVSVTDLTWSDPSSQVSPRNLWNYLQIGGNSFNAWVPQSQAAEQWYAIDDLVISTLYIGPNYIIGGGSPPDTMPPAPPTLN